MARRGAQGSAVLLAHVDFLRDRANYVGMEQASGRGQSGSAWLSVCMDLEPQTGFRAATKDPPRAHVDYGVALTCGVHSIGWGPVPFQRPSRREKYDSVPAAGGPRAQRLQSLSGIAQSRHGLLHHVQAESHFTRKILLSFHDANGMAQIQ